MPRTSLDERIRIKITGRGTGTDQHVGVEPDVLAPGLQGSRVVLLQPPNYRLNNISTLEVQFYMFSLWRRRDGVHEGVEGEVGSCLRRMGMNYGRLRRGPYEIRLDGRYAIVLQRRL